jgi:nucleoside 2-deoxyribosyltransferase
LLIYFAAPLFSAAERTFDERLTAKLEDEGFTVFLPQRDGVEGDKPPYDAMPPDERRRAMFELDREKILESDVFLFVLDGRVPDEGACVELGIAHAHKHLHNAQKLLVGLHTDDRAAFLGSKLNPMIRVPLDRITEDEGELIGVLKRHQPSKAGETA